MKDYREMIQQTLMLAGLVMPPEEARVFLSRRHDVAEALQSAAEVDPIIRKRLEGVFTPVAVTSHGIHVNRSNRCGYCELVGHSSRECPDRNR